MVPDTFYHLYNRGNNKQKVFFTDENYSFFLKYFDTYLSPVLNVYAYCLLPNHYHILIKTKPETEVSSLTIFGKKLKYKERLTSLFKKFFISYAKAINKQESRTGSLFEKPFHRKYITNENYLIRTILYIHLNPFHHKLNTDYRKYKWSSYVRFMNNKPSRLMKEEVLNMFGSRENFLVMHEEQKDVLSLNEFEKL